MNTQEMVKHPLYPSFKQFICQYYGDIADGSTMYKPSENLNDFEIYLAGFNDAMAHMRDAEVKV